MPRPPRYTLFPYTTLFRSLAVSRAKELGIREVAMPSAGNAGGALAAYAAKAGIAAHIFMPRDTPVVNVREASLFGARVRSEELTSELQSPDHLVCRLLLEK